MILSHDRLHAVASIERVCVDLVARKLCRVYTGLGRRVIAADVGKPPSAQLTQRAFQDHTAPILHS
jgi:hypothetical protein